MDISSNPAQTTCARRNDRPVSQMRWELPRVSAYKEEQALKLCRVNVMRPTTPRFLHREQMRVDPVWHTKASRKKNGKVAMSNRQLTAAWLNSRPAGAMAPGNTTQYLMSKVYEDVTTDGVGVTNVRNENVYRDCLSPPRVYAELDSCYESSIDYQMQDFEGVFDQYW